MTARRRSSKERSPPWLSGWWRFTCSLNLALISAAEASISSPSVSKALRSALRIALASCLPGTGRACARSGVHAHAPRRAVPGDGVLLVRDHVVVGEPGEIVVVRVVLADMVEAVAPVLSLASAALRRAMRSALVATRPFAGARRARFRLLARAPDADFVEQGRVELHRRIMIARLGRHKERTRPFSPASLPSG
jgi:hypothetical protein